MQSFFLTIKISALTCELPLLYIILLSRLTGSGHNAPFWRGYASSIPNLRLMISSSSSSSWLLPIHGSVAGVCVNGGRGSSTGVRSECRLPVAALVSLPRTPSYARLAQNARGHPRSHSIHRSRRRSIHCASYWSAFKPLDSSLNETLGGRGCRLVFARLSLKWCDWLTNYASFYLVTDRKNLPRTKRFNE